MRTFASGDDSVKDYNLVDTDDGDRPQLVHCIHYIEQPSSLDRFAALLGLAKGDKPVIEEVKKAYEFITRKYAAGDQVILCVRSFEKWETDRGAKVAEVLARHLHDGTYPANLVNAQPGNGGNRTGSRIPIYAVVVDRTCAFLSSSGAETHSNLPSVSDWDEIQSISAWSDWLKSRLPLGIQHMVCFSYDGGFRSGSTMYDLGGAIISREVCTCRLKRWYVAQTWHQFKLRFSGQASRWGLERGATKHVLYYRQHRLPKLDEHKPVWTCVLNSSSHQAQVLPLELMKPSGMHHHEVQSYEGLPWRMGGGSMLVWKSYREAPN
ncbi:unnamed protein product [Rhizoctonia solani]|uniref:Uncharacterized protein n=1 Tax=Rhizoctonia solani TaxID=456999 RepID=A0A8H3DU75_9AGAM|nr:unnamed protein product [Rhizoctonia solani]